jgi:hypothetical protein
MSIKYIRETKDKNWNFYAKDDYRNLNKQTIQNYFRGDYKIEKDKFQQLFSPRNDTEVKEKPKIIINGLPSAFNYQ